MYRLEALNLGWTNLSRESVIHLACCLTPGLLKLNISGCRETLVDNGIYILVLDISHHIKSLIDRYLKMYILSANDIEQNLPFLSYYRLQTTIDFLSNTFII